MLRAIPLSELPVEPTSAEDDRLEDEDVRQIRDHLAKLPAHERDALEARARLSDRSCRAVAKSYNVSPQTVCNWADAAERKLRPVLEGFL